MTSHQMSTGSGKAAKFVAANPLAPMADPFSGLNEDNQSEIQAAISENVDRRLKNAIKELQEKHSKGTNEIDPIDRAPTGEPYQRAAAAARHKEDVERRDTERRMAQQQETKRLFQNDDNEGSDDDDSSDDDDDLLDDPELDAIRTRRLDQIRQTQIAHAENLSKGHGQYRTISQDEFLPECTGSSEFVVVHFTSDEFQRCQIMDRHLQTIAPQHVECKFLRLEATKAPFFVKKLNVRTLPTLIVFRDGKAVERLMGFEGLSLEDAEVDVWPTSRLQLWLAGSGAIKYEMPKEEVLEEMRRMGLEPKGVVWSGMKGRRNVEYDEGED